MKRKNALVSILMLVALLVCNINITYAADSTTSISGQEWKEKSQIITDEINDLNGVQVSVDTIRVLYDVEINPTYLYIKFKDKGYAVTSRENMELIVYDLGCENNPLDDVSTNDMIVYGGGFSFYKYRNDQLTSLLDNEVINRSDITKEQKQINRALLSDKTETSSYLVRATAYGYTGLSSGSFSGYSGSGWINNTSNDCGSYCAAVLLAYFDDNVSNSYIPDRIRKQRDNSYSAAQSLVKSLIACIDPDHSGTVASEVGGGINNWLYVYSSVSNRTSYSTIGGTWDKATSVISNSKRPIIIGTLKILGAEADHWVVAYQHRLDSSDNGYYKCVNVWGSYTAEIKAKHTRGWVTLNG